MNLWKTLVSLALVAAALAGCSGKTASSAAAASDAAAAGAEGEYSSAALPTGYEDALPVSSQLALGTLKLEETENAVTAKQAAKLLPLWQAIQSGVLSSDLETNTVLRQIEETMTSEQLAAIAAMQLTAADMQTMMQERGMPAGGQPGAAGPSGAGTQGGAPGDMPSGAPAGGGGPMGNMTEEQMAAMRATAEAGGASFPGAAGGGQNSEEMAAMRATAQAGGASFPSAAGGAGTGQIMMLARSVVELLKQRAAE